MINQISKSIIDLATDAMYSAPDARTAIVYSAAGLDYWVRIRVIVPSTATQQKMPPAWIIEAGVCVGSVEYRIPRRFWSRGQGIEVDKIMARTLDVGAYAPIIAEGRYDSFVIRPMTHIEALELDRVNTYIRKLN